jgi:hypothetical protein
VLASSPAMSTEEHDREAGRQLAWLLAVVTVLAVGGMIWLGRSEPIPPVWLLAPVGLVALTVAAFVWPVIVIRAVSGRFTEILDQWSAGQGPQAKGIADDVRPTLAALEDGTPLEVMAAENVVKSVAGRKRLGKLLMLGGLAGCGLLVPLWGRIPEDLAVLPAFVFVGGLVVWYRTL